MDSAAFIAALADYGYGDRLTATKVRAIQLAVRDIERRRPWPFLEADPLNLTFNGSSDIATNTPARLRAVIRAKDLTARRRVIPIRVEDLEDLIGADYSRVASPIYYYYESGDLKFWPIPTASTSVKLRYLVRSAVITDTSAESAYLVPPEHHDVILMEALAILAESEDDIELAVHFRNLKDKRLEEMVEDIYHWQYDEPDFIRVLDPTDWQLDF